MGVECIREREREMLRPLLDRFEKIDGVEILGSNTERLGIVSFMIRNAHYNLIVKILNDRFGIQARGGCSCAGTYGHVLLGIDEARSYGILDSLRAGELWSKPGWVRLSIHPTMTDAEIDYIIDAVEITAEQYEEWGKDYKYDPASNEYNYKAFFNPY
jgi:selenocysteine lyase/cysteine desulfurase